ncbi:hypothetical protein K6T82_23940 [Flavobacterium sp. 17A]|uniref:Antitoxin n=1 Tax=Flavobacterium potami TaxID=2872310 RepID=A0A9X1HFY6_9FLAO|nr:hypothetical protein [Flavobacterium potami]MBZ4037830.1 hypothetical protein [Flavobacterium potami]
MSTKTVKSEPVNVNVTTFRDKLKDYLEVAENEILIVNGKNGKRYIVAPIKDAEENLSKTITQINSKIKK